MAEITYQMILSTLQTVSIMIGIIYYLTILRNTQKTRELTLQSQELSRKAQEQAMETRNIQLFMQLFRDFNNEENLTNLAELFNLKPTYEEYLEKYDSHVNPSFFARRFGLWYFFNSIGEMLRLDFIDLDLLNRLNIDINVIVVWENWGHIIRKNREVENMPDVWDGFEFLYTEMKSFRDAKGYPDITYNP